MQSRELYKKIVFDLILEYKIKVKRWRSTNSGWAYFEDWQVEIPKPISLSKFITCIHEIGHLVKDKSSNPLWKSEYTATKFAFDICNKHGIIIPEKEIRNNLNYLICCIADDICSNGTDFKKIDKSVLEYAKVDIKLWKQKIRKGYLPYVISKDSAGFYRLKTDWVKKKL